MMFIIDLSTVYMYMEDKKIQLLPILFLFIHLSTILIYPL